MTQQCKHNGQFTTDRERAENGSFTLRVKCADCGTEIDTYNTNRPEVIEAEFSQAGRQA